MFSDGWESSVVANRRMRTSCPNYRKGDASAYTRPHAGQELSQSHWRPNIIYTPQSQRNTSIFIKRLVFIVNKRIFDDNPN